MQHETSKSVTLTSKLQAGQRMVLYKTTYQYQPTCQILTNFQVLDNINLKEFLDNISSKELLFKTLAFVNVNTDTDPNMETNTNARSSAIHVHVVLPVLTHR